MKSYINIDKAEFYSYHGVMPQERVVGNSFLVSLKVEVDVLAATESDRLEDTLSYAEMFDVVRSEMAVPSSLLEHVAGRIVKSLRQRFPAIRKIDITVTKKNPPIVGQMEGVGVRLVED
jgi:dihydroneopterin aldolase